MPRRMLEGTMDFMIFDRGNLLVSYNEKQPALDALTKLVNDDPESADDFVLAVFDDRGELTDESVAGSSVREPQAA